VKLDLYLISRVFSRNQQKKIQKKNDSFLLPLCMIFIILVSLENVKMGFGWLHDYLKDKNQRFLKFFLTAAAFGAALFDKISKNVDFSL